MTRTRRPSVSGTFYPANARALSASVTACVDGAEPAELHRPPKALVVPHAGYVYSGPVAGSAYAALAPHVGMVSRVVLLGPSHRVPFRGLACSAVKRFLTPLGDVEVDRAAYEAVADLSYARTFEAPYEGEHCLEVQLPFLQQVLAGFRIVPFLVGEATAEEVAEVLELLWGGDETLIVVSSDLSHFLTYERAREIDAATCRSIEALRPEEIGYDQACGRIPLNGLLRAAERHGLEAVTLDLRNSGDTAGSRSQVVGYGAWAFVESAAT